MSQLNQWFKIALLAICLSSGVLGLASTDGADSKKLSKTEQVQAQQVNINTATSEELQTLPRVGPATAQRIIEFRETNKGFKSAEELMNVRGIGAKTFDALAPLITI